MIVANNIVPEEFRDAREGIAQKSAADVTDMHRLGHIRRAEIDHDFRGEETFSTLSRSSPRSAAIFVSTASRLSVKLMKPAPATLGCSEMSGDGEVSDYRLGYFARIFTALFPEHERSVALIIPKAWIGRGLTSPASGKPAEDNASESLRVSCD